MHSRPNRRSQPLCRVLKRYRLVAANTRPSQPSSIRGSPSCGPVPVSPSARPACRPSGRSSTGRPRPHPGRLDQDGLEMLVAVAAFAGVPGQAGACTGPTRAIPARCGAVTGRSCHNCCQKPAATEPVKLLFEVGRGWLIRILRGRVGASGSPHGNRSGRAASRTCWRRAWMAQALPSCTEAGMCSAIHRPRRQRPVAHTVPLVESPDG